MESITRSVKDIDWADRQAIEHVLGQTLSDDQQIIIHVQSQGAKPADQAGVDQPEAIRPPDLPEWCNVYEGLSDAEVAEIEKSIVRSPGSRSLT